MKRGLLAVLLLFGIASTSGCCCVGRHLHGAKHRVGNCLRSCWFLGLPCRDHKCRHGHHGHGYGHRGHAAAGHPHCGCGHGGGQPYGHHGHGHHGLGRARCAHHGCGDPYCTDLFLHPPCDPCDHHGHWMGRGNAAGYGGWDHAPNGEWIVDQHVSHKASGERVVNSHPRETPSKVKR